jgi:hypothetical protein
MIEDDRMDSIKVLMKSRFQFECRLLGVGLTVLRSFRL